MISKILKLVFLKKSTVVICSILFSIIIFSSLAYLATLAVVNDTNFLSLPNSSVITASNSILPLTGYIQIPKNISSCNFYSAEVAFEANINGLKTIVNGANFINFSYFSKAQVISGNWPSNIFEIALGNDLAKKLNASLGSKVIVKNLLTNNEQTFIVSSIYKSKYAILNEEAVINLEAARNLSNIPEGYYSYIRIPNGCHIINSTTSVTFAQIFSRFLRGFQSSLSSVAIYSGTMPLVNEASVISLIIVISTLTSAWIATRIYLSSFEREIMILYEIGVSLKKVKFILIIAAIILTASVSFAASAISYYLLSQISFVSSLHYAAALPSFLYATFLPILAIFISLFSIIFYKFNYE